MVSKRGASKLLGILAVEKRWIKQEGLEVALKIQRTKGGFIGSILLSEKLINQQQLDMLLIIQEEAEAREDEYLFGSIAVENNLITAEQLLDALEEQRKNFFRKNIGEVLIEHKLLTEADCESVLKVQKRLNNNSNAEEKKAENKKTVDKKPKEKKVKQDSTKEKTAKSKCPKCEYIYLIRDPDRCRKVRCKKCSFIFEVGSKELKADSSQLIQLQKETAKDNSSISNRFFEYLSENDLIDEKQFKKLNETGEGQRYLVGDEIARGGMGVILSTSDTNLRRNIVTKVHLKNKSRLATLRFIEEAQITGQLEHPNIPPVYDLGLNKDQNLFFTMKHIKGETLESIIDRLAFGDPATEEKYHTNQLINIFLKVCDALNYAHDKKVLHRDIKPENIMIGEFGEVLLMDWGLAKIIGAAEEVEELSSADLDSGKISSVRSEDELSQTVEGTTAGTPAFMPPEQALGLMDELDARSDLYSLGASLYYAITLQKPIVGTNLREILEDAAHGNVRPIPDHVPVELASIIRKSMEEKPRNRYSAIKEFEDDLKKYQSGYSVSVKQDNIFGMAKKLYKRNKLIFILSGIISVFVIFGSVLSMTLLNQQRNKAIEQKLMSENALKNTRDLLAKFNVEKTQRSLENFESAPSYYAQAELDITNKKYKKAMANINLAIKYDSLKAEYHCLRAGLYLHRRDYKKAMKGFRYCLSKKYMKRNIQSLIKLLRASKNRRTDPKVVASLIKHLLRLQLFGLAETYSPNIKTSFEIWREQLRVKWSKGGYSLGFDGKKKEIKLSIQNNVSGKDFKLLRGMKISHLNLYYSNINSIDFIENMKLKSVSIQACPDLKNLEILSKQKIRFFSLRNAANKNLNFLKNSQLESLYLERTPVTSLEALRNQPIKNLTILFIPIDDMSVLKSFKIERFNFAIQTCNNLDFLKGSKLKSFSLSWSYIADISALKSTPIESLKMYRVKLDFKNQIGELDLKELSYHDNTKTLDFVLKNKNLEKFSFFPKKGTVPKNWEKILKRHPNKNLKFYDQHSRKKGRSITEYAKYFKKRQANKKKK